MIFSSGSGTASLSMPWSSRCQVTEGVVAVDSFRAVIFSATVFFFMALYSGSQVSFKRWCLMRKAISDRAASFVRPSAICRSELTHFKMPPSSCSRSFITRISVSYTHLTLPTKLEV